jgi:hypothetical protein
MYIAICYFAPINYTFYKKNNLNSNFPYNNLEQDIYSSKNEGNIPLLGDFNARTTTKQATLLSNDSNHNPLWLDEDVVLSNSYKRSSKELIENLFGTKLVKLCNSQDLIICNGVMKWQNSNQMTCIHGLGSSVVDYVISDIQKFWSQILNRNTKENNMIPLRDWNSYLKSLYEFPNAMDTIPIVPTKDEVFSLDDIEFGVKHLQGH